MDGSLPIPDYQPLPFPAPVWLLKVFLILGFYAHALPMNVALTGGIVAALFLFYGHHKRHGYAYRLGNTLAFSLPFFVSVAITQGIVPLLFLQLVYGPLFYTSSILMALPWLSIIFLLLFAYYAYYLFTYHPRRLKGYGPWMLLGAGLLFLTIAFFFTNNMTLMLLPERWTAMYQANPSGVSLNLADPQILPRYLHFIVAAFAVTGLTIGCFGLYWHARDREYGQWLIRTGAGLFLLPTLLQLPIGIWFLVSLKPFIMWGFLGNDPFGTTIFVASMLLDLVGIVAMTLAWRDGYPKPFGIGLVTALVVILLMVIIRHLVRVYATQAVLIPERMVVETQWGLLILFLGSIVIGVAYIAWLIKLTWQAFHPTPPAEAKAV